MAAGAKKVTLTRHLEDTLFENAFGGYNSVGSKEFYKIKAGTTIISLNMPLPCFHISRIGAVRLRLLADAGVRVSGFFCPIVFSPSSRSALALLQARL